MQRSDDADTRPVCQEYVHASKQYWTHGHLRRFRLVVAEAKIRFRCLHHPLGNMYDRMDVIFRNLLPVIAITIVHREMVGPIEYAPYKRSDTRRRRVHRPLLRCAQTSFRLGS